MRKPFLVTFLVGALLGAGLTALAAEGDYTQPQRAMRALWSSYSHARGSGQMELRVELRDSAGSATREAVVIFRQGQPVIAHFDGRQVQLAALPPAALLTAVQTVNSEFSTLVSTRAAAGDFNAQ